MRYEKRGPKLSAETMRARLQVVVACACGVDRYCRLCNPLAWERYAEEGATAANIRSAVGLSEAA